MSNYDSTSFPNDDEYEVVCFVDVTISKAELYSK